MNNLKAIIIASLSIAILSACNSKKAEEKKAAIKAASTPKEITNVTGIARIEPEKGLLYIYSNGDGKIENIFANVNDMVKQGQQLVSIEKSEEEAQLTLEQAKISAQNSSISAAEAQAKSMMADLNKAEADVALNEKLLQAKAITEQALNDSKAKVVKLKLDYDKQLSEIKTAKNKMQEIDASIKYRKVLLNDKNINAVCDGKILEWTVHNGDYIIVGQKLGQFAPSGSLIAVTEIDELFAAKVKLGMKAEIISQMNGGKIGDGEVIFVAEFLKKKSLFSDENTVEDRRVKEVKVRLTPKSNVVINSRVDCKINLK